LPRLPETSISSEQKDADSGSQSLAMEQLYQAISFRQRTTRREFVPPSVRLSRLKSRYMSRREQRVTPAHWSTYLPQPLSLKPPSSSTPRCPTPNLLMPTMPQLSASDRRDSRLERIPAVVIVEVDEDEEGRQSEFDAKV